jgi:hypothetical protein
MAYTTEGFRPLRHQLRMEGGVESTAPAGPFDGTAGNVHAIDPAGADSAVILATEETSDGLLMWFANTGTAQGTVTIRDDASVVLHILTNGESILLACDGTTWNEAARGRAGGGINVQVLAGDLVLGSGAQEYQQLDPGGANRLVTPPAAASFPNRSFSFANFADAAENLDIGGVVTINQNEAVRIVSDGAAWQHMGVRTIALT